MAFGIKRVSILVDFPKQILHCQGVVQDLLKRFQSTAFGVAHIYSDFKRHHERKLNDLLSSLSKQLLLEYRKTPDSVRNLYIRYKTRGSHRTTQEVVEALNSICTKFSRIFLVIAPGGT
jgi:hypothetical protein